MTYRVYIKKDYKPVVRWVPDRPRFRPIPHLLVAGGLAIGAGLVPEMITPNGSEPAAEVALPNPAAAGSTRTSPAVPNWAAEEVPAAPAPAARDPDPAPVAESWQEVQISRGDNLSLVFDRLGLSPATLHKVMSSGTDAGALTRLMPGDTLRFRIREQELVALQYEPSLTELLTIEKTDDAFIADLQPVQLEKRVSRSQGTISSSLFLAGQEAGLSDNLIMQLAAIYGWDIDFVLDIREGDSFRVIYEEQFKDGEKVTEGPILAAEFVNRGNFFRAVRYVSAEERPDYYSEDGVSMRKAFLRSPLNFTRVSSRFNLNRKHPILNTIRAHTGVDYAAPTDTPIKASGDGTVAYVGNKGGYGRTVILRHGGVFQTLYAHMSRYAGDIRTGRRVQQGETIGYVGMSGLATGPHLHYEFQVNGQHRDPLTVPLPKADGIPSSRMARFQAETAPLFARLDATGDQGADLVAMREQEGDARTIR